MDKCDLAEHESEAVCVRTLPAMPDSGGKWVVPTRFQEEALKKMELCGQKFGDVADVFYGIITGNDSVFAVSPTGKKGKDGGVFVTSKASKEPFLIEAEILRPFALGKGTVGRYCNVKTPVSVVWPYNADGTVMGEETLQKRCPLAWEYLSLHKDILKGDPWYGFVGGGGMSRMSKPKLMTTFSGNGKAKVGIDVEGGAVAKGSGSGCCVAVRNEKYSLEMLLGILNSGVVYDYISLRARGYHDDFVYSTELVREIPIPKFDAKTAPVYEKIQAVVRKLLKTKDTKERLSLENELDGLVRDLYGLVSKQESFIVPFECLSSRAS